MDTSRIAELLEPFLAPSARTPVPAGVAAPDARISPLQLEHISIYIDLLLRWNARISLTAIRDPEDVVTRHFGESLFAAHLLFPGDADGPGRTDALLNPHTRPARDNGVSVLSRNDLSTTEARESPAQHAARTAIPGRLLDLGSGAGFPGLPIKIWSPKVPVTLIESNQKKVAFLREVIRALTLMDIDVFPRRSEAYPVASASVVTLRAVERFEDVLGTAARLIAPGGRLVLLIGQSQTGLARQLPAITWEAPLLIPNSQSRVLLVGHAAKASEPHAEPEE